jgi:hypothetical protein
VLLFVRPVNGVYLPPKVLRLKGKSAVDEIAVATKDMPNFFVEAVTVADGRVFTEMKEIIVPPEKRVLNIELTPSAENFKPGEKATVKVKVTDFFGKPFVGSTVVTMYDKALEYIASSNVAEIKSFFWNWRRSHHPYTETSLQRGSGNIDLPNKPGMDSLGVFGETVADEVQEAPGDMAVRSPRMNGAKMAFGARAKADFAGEGAPAMAAAPMPEAAGGEASGAGGGQAMAQPMIRTKFADAAFWIGALTTNAKGEAEIALAMPENLTAWKVRVWGMGQGTRVGQAEAEVVTRKNLILRQQAPRFFVEKDEVVLSANVHNYLKTKKNVQVVLELVGPSLVTTAPATQTVEIDAGSEKRVDWLVRVAQEGEAVIRMKALTDEESDAMEQRFPVYVHGMLKTESYAGVIRPDKNAAELSIRVPDQRRVEESRLEIRYSPTLAGAMVDALPYMVDYPYGCTEQTLNRFLPTVVTQKILLDMKLDLKAIRDKRTNLNAQELGDAAKRAEGWKRYERNPVFDVYDVECPYRCHKKIVQTEGRTNRSRRGFDETPSCRDQQDRNDIGETRRREVDDVERTKHRRYERDDGQSRKYPGHASPCLLAHGP